MSSVTVQANGLEIAHKGSGGYEKNSSPDMCLTPVGSSVQPIAYKITSYTKDLVRGTTTVFADGGNPISVKGSAHAIGYGDARGVLGGQLSGTFLHESTWITNSPNVFIEGKPVGRKTDKLFMNNRNCVAGDGGNYEPPLSLTDVEKELCRIFCESRDEWHKCKDGGGGASLKTSSGKCKRPSRLAEEKTKKRLNNPKSKLNKAIKKDFPGRTGAAEKSFYHKMEKIGNKITRKIYNETAFKNAVKRQLNRALKKAAVEKAVKMGKKAWMKFVPGLNIISTVVDAVDLAYTGYEIYDMINKASNLDDVIKVKPDFAIEGPDGSVEKIYDFKFDDPVDNYEDKFSKDQMEAYKASTNGDKPEAIDKKKCKCPDTPRDLRKKGMS